jgi:hypothetical protein
MFFLADTVTGLTTGVQQTLKCRALPQGKVVKAMWLKFVGTWMRGIGAVDHQHEPLCEMIRAITLNHKDIAILFQHGNEACLDYFLAYRQRLARTYDLAEEVYTLHIPILLERQIANKAERKLTRPTTDYLENANVTFNVLETVFDATDIADVDMNCELWLQCEDSPAGYMVQGGRFVKNNTNFSGNTLPVNESFVVSDRLLFSSRTDADIPAYTSFSLHSDGKQLYTNMESDEADLLGAEHDQPKMINGDIINLGSPGLEDWPALIALEDDKWPLTLIVDRRNQKDLGQTLNVTLTDRDNDQDISWYYSGWRQLPRTV